MDCSCKWQWICFYQNTCITSCFWCQTAPSVGNVLMLRCVVLAWHSTHSCWLNDVHPPLIHAQLYLFISSYSLMHLVLVWSKYYCNMLLFSLRSSVDLVQWIFDRKGHLTDKNFPESWNAIINSHQMIPFDIMWLTTLWFHK